MISKSSPWYPYAVQNQPASNGPSPPPARLEWGTGVGTGPGAAAFGRELRGRRILELGCGQGHNAAHLAGHHRAQVTAVDMVDLQIRHACDHYGYLSGLTFLTCDAMRFLRQDGPVFDVVYSVFGAIGLIDPRQLLPAVARRLRPHGVLVFSVPHPRRAGTPTIEGTQPRHGVLRLHDGSHHLVARWELDVPGWWRTLAQAGMRVTAIDELGPPQNPRPTALMITARRN